MCGWEEVGGCGGGGREKSVWWVGGGRENGV